MATTQSVDPNERVDHPRHYNQHPSGIECIELIEHLPYNLGAAVKYIWRCGLKKSETPLRDLQSAQWYTKRECQRYLRFWAESPPQTGAWHPLARKVLSVESESLLSRYLNALLERRFDRMITVLQAAITDLKNGDSSS